MALYARTGERLGTTVDGLQSERGCRGCGAGYSGHYAAGHIAAEATARAAGDASEATARANGDASLNGAKVNKAGDVMAGPLTLQQVGFQGVGPRGTPTVSAARAPATSPARRCARAGGIWAHQRRHERLGAGMRKIRSDKGKVFEMRFFTQIAGG